MKKLFDLIGMTILMSLFSCQGNAQKDLTTLTPAQWQEDLDYLSNRIHKSFAGFTPQTKQKFTTEVARVRNEIPQLNTSQRILEFARLLALLRDGHTEISLTGYSSGFHRFPFILYYFGQDLYVIGAGESDGPIIGMKLVRINGTPVSEVFEKLKPYMNCDNDIEYITTAPNLMAIPEILNTIGIIPTASDTKLTLVDESGEENDHVVKAITIADFVKLDFKRAYQTPPLYLENPNRDYWYRYLSESNVMYINMKYMVNQRGQVSLKKMIKEFFDEVDKVNPDKIVIDVRLCRGGNYNNALPLVDEITSRPSLNKEGKVFVVNGRLTFSAASVATLHLKDNTHSILIGEVSRARPNWAENMESYELPHSGLDFDCTEELRVHSALLKGSDVIPMDINIPRSFEKYKMGKDEVMEYILSR